MQFWNFIQNQDNAEEVELRIEGEITMDDDFWSMLFGIETVTPKGFRAQLAEHAGKNITVWINSYGGDTVAASQIYTALREHKGKVITKTDGIAFSAASVLMMAGDEAYMAPTALLGIHNPWTVSQGDARDMRHMAEVLDQVKESIINAYQTKSGKSRNKIARMMDDETWMSAQKALDNGFIDGILYADNIAAIENSFMFSRASIQNNTATFMRQYAVKMKELLPQDSDIELLERELSIAKLKAARLRRMGDGT